jgi:hypothetical protein
MTIHGSPGTLDVVVQMLAGLWGEGRAPIPLQLIPLAEGRRRQTYSRTPEWRPTSTDWRSEALPMMSTKEHVEWLRS